MLRPALSALTAVCAAVMVLLGGATAPWAQEKVGISSAVNQNATGVPPGQASRRLVIGQEVVFNERITTEQQGQTQLLFLDESSMSIGPNSDVTIDQFVYDPKSGTGKLAMSATKGLLRFVGGKLSKQDQGVTLQTNSATLAVRGGAFIARIGTDGRLTAIFIYGRGLTITGVNGVSQTIQRPGFEVTVAGPGASPSGPTPAPAGELDQLLAQLDGRPGGTGGAATVPTDQTVASSGVGQTISGNFAASVQQAMGQVQTRTPPTFNPATAPITAAVQSTTSLALNCAIQANCAAQSVQVGTTSSGQPVGGPNSVVLSPPSPTPPTPTPPIPTSPQTVTLTYAGRVKNTNGNGTARGFVTQGGTADLPYSGGTLTFPAGQPQNGVFTASASAGSISFPLAPGSNTFGPQGTASSFGTFTGTSFLSADHSFFYASLVPTSAPTERVFIFGGMPVNSSFYQPTGSNRPLAFNIQPDAALQSGIPFVRNQAGGGLPNASVSQLYVLAPPSTAIGDATTPTAARALQGSLAISGQGSNQQSVVAVTTGTVNALQSSGQPILNGQLRGSSVLSAFSAPTRIQSAVSSTVDGAGNSFYGTNGITGFVLDQTAYNSGGTGITTSAIIPSTASEVSPSGGIVTYGFAQPALAGTTPAGLGATRTTQTLTGNFGGLMATTAQPQPYVLTGGVSVATNQAANRIQANFNGSASPSSGPVTLNLQYGGSSGPDAGGQAFIDDSHFAAVESPTSPSGVKAYFMNANVAPPPNSLLPAGASYCQCQFLQWGYWGGDVPLTSPNSTSPRIDRGHINFWAAGPATPLSDIATLQGQSFVGTYNGHAIGSVFNNGANYVAAGGFNGTYNFGTRAANFTISNFDGNTLTASGTVPLNGASYTLSGTAPRTGMAGTFNGTFYGPMAAETGGNFSVQSTLGVPYLASGIFAGKR